MEWAHRMNEAVSYIEEHLTEEVDLSHAARIACCSVYHFQRMFPYIAGVPLTEYIRKRRLALAAYELQNSGIKIIDLALKYGYESPEAFARAFQNMHGTSPSAARQAGTLLKDYPRIYFQFSMRGAADMNYRIEELLPFSVVGYSRQVSTEHAYDVIPRIWEEAMHDDIIGKLWTFRQPDHPIRGILGVCADGDYGRHDMFDYILSVVSDQSQPATMVRRHFPASAWAVFETGSDPGGMADMWRRLYAEWIPSQAYEPAPLPAIECYLPPHEARNELWVPVIRKA